MQPKLLTSFGEKVFIKFKKKYSGSWKILYAYYLSFTAIVSVDGIRSNEFATIQGVKQGGVRSPFL